MGSISPGHLGFWLVLHPWIQCLCGQAFSLTLAVPANDISSTYPSALIIAYFRHALLSHFDFVSTSCRKIPWINIYAQVQHDKEQEMIGSVSQSENAPKITLSDFTEPEELLDKELDTRVIGMCACATTLKVLCPPDIVISWHCMCH